MNDHAQPLHAVDVAVASHLVRQEYKVGQTVKGIWSWGPSYRDQYHF